MSLLLDALKKAAEQKAAKKKDETPGTDAGSAEETALDVSAEEARDADDTSIPQHKLEDETEFDHSELDTRLEHMQVDQEDRTSTSIDVPDDTQLLEPSPHEQINSGEDETLVFAEDEVTDLTAGQSGDRTDLTQQTSLEEQAELTQRTTREDETEFIQQSHADQTEISEGPPAEPTDFTQRTALEDETEFVQQAPGAEQTEFTEEPSTEQTEFTQSSPSADETQSKTAEDEDDTSAVDDDMSLLLVEREATQLTSPTSVTDPQQPRDALRALDSEATVSEETRQQADPTLRKSAGDQTSSTDTAQSRAGSSDTSTTSPASFTQTTRATLARSDATETHTYAPDNYDRTLMRLPSDDASRLFAGMKSDSDVVMTPDYAKQVFRSKSSAQRVQHYKFYSAIAVAILLAIGVYGIFEYQAESDLVDTNLRPLKVDPMPGIIGSANGTPKNEPLFVEAEVNERALEIIQGLEEGELSDDAPRAAGEDVAAGQMSSAGSAADTAPAVQAATAEDEPAPRQAVEDSRAIAGESTSGSRVAMAAAADNTTISGTISSQPANNSRSSGSRLQIETGKRIEEKQLLLREAYNAYQSGNDELALQRYRQVLAIDPGNRNALLARAAIHVQNGDSVAAIGDYQTLLLANPKDSLALASLITVANYSPEETETQLKLMIREEPESPYLNFALANAYGAQNRWQEAQGHYYRALQNNPDDPNYAYNLAVSLEHIAQPRAAVSYYRRALENYDKGLATFSRDVVDRRLEKLILP